MARSDKIPFEAIAEFSALPQEKISEFMAAEQREKKATFEREKAKAGACFTDDFMKELAGRFKIPPDRLPILKDHLVFAAWVYRDRQREIDETATSRATKEEIGKVREAAGQLRSAIDALSSGATDQFWLGQRWVDENAFRLSSGKTPHGVSPYGHTIVCDQLGDGVEQVRYLRKPQLREAVEIIENLAADAVARLPRDAGGRPSDLALWIWIVNLQTQHEKILGCKFTYNSYEEGISDAFGYCCAVTTVLDSTITPTQIASTMRKAIALARKAKGTKPRKARKRRNPA